jgi:hypothetical protein
MNSKKLLLTLITPSRLEKYLNVIRNEGSLPEKVKDDIINIIQSLTGGIKQAKADGLTDDELVKILDSDKS